MSVIFPGNYVAHLNAYRTQGVFSLPGVEFYQMRGLAYVTANKTGGGTLALVIPSPDLRQDDKPRLDKLFVVPAGSVVYRTAISAPGVKTVAGGTVVVKAAAGLPTSPSLEAEDGSGEVTEGYYPAEGVTSALASILDGTALGSDTAIQVTTDTVNVASLDPSAGACRNSPSAILVEVCYYRPAPAPDAEDAHIPYAIEAGSGT